MARLKDAMVQEVLSWNGMIAIGTLLS